MLYVYIHIHIRVHTPTHTHTRTSVARAFAINVLLHPGGPYNSTPDHESWYMSISLDTYECPIRMRHGTSVARVIVRVMVRAAGVERHVYMCHDSFTGVGRLIHICRDSFTRTMTHWYVSWRIHTYVMVRVNESWYVSINHGTCQWVMVRINESWYVSMSHDTYERVSLPLPMSHGTREWVMPQINGIPYSCERVTTHIHESLYSYEWVTGFVNESWHMWRSHATCDRVLCAWTCLIWIGRDTYEWVSLPLWLSHGPCEIVMAHMIGSCVHEHVSYT